MSLVDRVKNILLTPRTEWPIIAGESATVGSLYTGYIMILAAIGPIALVLRWLIAGGLGAGISLVIVQYLFALLATYILAVVADALAPVFSGEKNFVASLKLVAYAFTASWLGGIFALLGPSLGGLLGLIASIYSFYLFYLGVPALKKVPADKAVGYTLIVIVCAIVLILVVSAIAARLFVGGAMLTGVAH